MLSDRRWCRRYAAAQEDGSGVVHDHLSGGRRAMSLLQASSRFPAERNRPCAPRSLNG